MKFGVILPNYDRTASWDAIKDVATLADNLNFHSVWTTDHLLVPKENVNPYGTMYETLTTLALVAHLAPRVQLGTSVVVLPMRNPVLFAKQATTIDVATHGRLILGVGVGWNEKEFKNLGEDFHSRGKRLDEDIQLLRTLWAKEEVLFHGKYTQVDDGYFSPLPTRKDIPVWIGGNGESSWRRVAKLGDGWQTTGTSPEETAHGIEQIRKLGPSRPLAFSARLSIDFDPNVSPTFQYRGNQRHRLAGAPAQMRSRLLEYAQVGVELVVLGLPWEKGILAGQGQMRQFAQELMSELT